MRRVQKAKNILWLTVKNMYPYYSNSLVSLFVFSQLSTAFIVFNPQCLASKPGITAGKQHGNSRAGTSVSLFLTNWLGFSSVAVCTDWLLDQAALGPYSLETPHSRNPASLSVLAVGLQMHESLHRVTSKPFRVH